MADFLYKNRVDLDNKVTPGVTTNWGDDNNDIFEDIMSKALSKDATSQTVSADLVLNGDISGNGVTTTGEANSLVKTDSNGNIGNFKTNDPATISTTSASALTVEDDSGDDVFKVDTNDFGKISFASNTGYIMGGADVGEYYRVGSIKQTSYGSGSIKLLTSNRDANSIAIIEILIQNTSNGNSEKYAKKTGSIFYGEIYYYVNGTNIEVYFKAVDVNNSIVHIETFGDMEADFISYDDTTPPNVVDFVQLPIN